MKANREDLLEKLDRLYKSYRLCEDHFEQRMFTSHLRNRLNTNAIPTLFPSLEGSSNSFTGDHTYYQSSLVPANILVIDNRELVPVTSTTASTPQPANSGRYLLFNIITTSYNLTFHTYPKYY